jgi:hypothetical protein
VRYKWYYERLEAALSIKICREPAQTLLSAFKAEDKEVFRKKEAAS